VMKEIHLLVCSVGALAQLCRMATVGEIVPTWHIDVSTS